MFTPDPNFSAWSFREKFSIRVSMSNFKSRKCTVQGKPVNPGCNSEGGGRGLIETGRLFKRGSETTIVSVLHKELEYKVEKLK